MRVLAYYNEIDPAAAAILTQLIADGVITPGVVDTRSIKDVQPIDLDGFTQCHFFAGGGLWSVAARIAGWPDDRPLWTGSCPCQPFSAAGKGLGTDDPRHLWPDFHRLIRARRPPVVMGEQVAGAPGYGWFDGVRADLAREGYAGRAVDFPACSIDAPHQRNRLYWIAVEHAEGERRGEGRAEYELRGWWPTPPDAFKSRLEGYPRHGDEGWRPEPHRPTAEADGAGTAVAMGYDHAARRLQHEGGFSTERRWCGHADAQGLHADSDRGGRAGRTEGEEWSAVGRTSSERHLLRNGTCWSDAEWIVCHDDKARRAKPGLRLLVDGAQLPLGLLRDEIIADAAEEVIAHGQAWDASYADTAEAVRVVWRDDGPEALSTAERAGVPVQLPTQAFLLDFLRCVLAACERVNHGRGVPEAGEQAVWVGVRSLRHLQEFGGSSRQWRSNRQHAVEYPDALRALSWVLARDAQTLWQATRDADASDNLIFRKGRIQGWRVGGNAIVPQAAAEVIAAFLDAEAAALRTAA